MNIVVEELKSSDAIHASEDFYIKWARQLASTKQKSINKLCIHFVASNEDCTINKICKTNRSFKLYSHPIYSRSIQPLFYSNPSEYALELREISIDNNCQLYIHPLYDIQMVNRETLHLIERFVNHYEANNRDIDNPVYFRQIEIHLCIKNSNGRIGMNFVFIEQSNNYMSRLR